MRRRRGRLPLIILGCAALLLGATLGMAASGIRPGPEMFAWFGGQGGPASAGPAFATDTAAGSAAPSALATEPGSSESASPLGTLTASAVASGGAPSASAVATASAAASAAPTAGASASAAPSPQTASGGQARAVYNGSRAKKVVALTFDDGYSPVALRQILAILKREHVTATFFPYGWAVHQDAEGWKMVVAAGYPIGNHTLTHTILTTLTPDQVTTELTRGHRTIDLYSGGKSVNLMRPPGGAFNAPTARAIAKAGYNTIVMWDVDTFDWQGPSAATILARAIKGTNGSIVLMHSGPLNTPKALPAIIANYRARGFTFVTVPELLGTN